MCLKTNCSRSCEQGREDRSFWVPRFTIAVRSEPCSDMLLGPKPAGPQRRASDSADFLVMSKSLP
jgi:hypothetical protein